MATNKTINGITYINIHSEPISKLSKFPRDVPHVFISVDPKPTKYGSYIATVKNEDTGEESRYYIPEYITRHSSPGKRFIYNGLEKKLDGSGHSYHSMLRS